MLDKDRDSLIKLLDLYNIVNYTINDDGSVDVNGDVNLNGWGIDDIPFEFNIVGGSFDVSNNFLKSLKGSPKSCDNFKANNCGLANLEFAPLEVKGYFEVSDNYLTSLKGCTKLIRGYFNCSDNYLESLEFGPREVWGDYNCAYNNLKTLKGAPKSGGYFNCSYNELTSLRYMPKLKEKLNCSHNKINSVENLKTSGGLCIVDISNNCLTNADKLVRSLCEFNIDQNFIKIECLIQYCKDYDDFWKTISIVDGIDREDTILKLINKQKLLGLISS